MTVLKDGTQVRTTQPDLSKQKDYWPSDWAKRRWGVTGKVLEHHDSHGLCYEVKHEDGLVAVYEPTEIEVISDVV